MKILVLSPHCDDAELSMGGTMARYSAEGHDVKLLTCIVPDEEVDGGKKKDGKSVRAQEQVSAAGKLGVDLEILDFDSYDFKFNRKYIKILDAAINSFSPDKVFTCWENDTHQDHKNLANMVYIASRKNNFSLYMYEAMIPGGFNTEAFRSQMIINITDFIETKEEAIACYNSVFGDNIEPFLEAVRARCRFRGERIGVKYAEGFKVIKEIIE